MKKFVFTIIIAIIVLTLTDYYSSYIGEISKDEAILIIDTRFTTLMMVLLVIFLFRKNLYYKEDKNES
jgi:hypothetical protein